MHRPVNVQLRGGLFNAIELSMIRTMTPIWTIAGLPLVLRTPCVLVLLLAGAYGAEIRSGYLLRHWDNEHGLPANSVNAVAPARDGYLWVGTPNGLSRFDGDRFVTRSAQGGWSLSTPDISSVLEGAHGELWVGTADEGLFRVQGGVAEAMPVGGEKVTVTSLALDAQGALLAAVADRGVWRWDGQWSVVSSNSLPSREVQALIADTQGTIWCLAGNRPAFERAGQWVPAGGGRISLS